MVRNVARVQEKDDDNPTKKFFKSLRGGTREFCEHTPIHGVPYTGQSGRTVVERVLWIIIIIVAISSCAFLISNIYKKWLNSPVVVDFSTEMAHIWEIPFPAVTICPEGYIMNLEDFDPEYDSCTAEAAVILKLSSYLAKIGNETTENFPLLSDECNFERNALEALLLLKKSGLQGTGIWEASDEIEMDYISTEKGICITFNMMDSKDIFKEDVIDNLLIIQKAKYNRTTDWSLRSGYRSEETRFPIRATSSGIMNSLMVVPITERRNETLEESEDEGSNTKEYIMFLHSPMDYPSPYKEVIVGPVDSSIMIYLKPRAIYADDHIESLSPEVRKCFFEHESVLRFFKHYTESNCELECLTNYTHKMCGCVPTYLPRTEDMRLCQTLKEVSCFKSAPDDLLQYDFHNRYKPGSCDCLPSCHAISYDAETVHSSFTGTDFENYASPNMYKIRNKINTSLLPNHQFSNRTAGLILVYFMENQFWPSVRSTLYGTMDFLSDCGGLMGLCMGVSFVSLIEIVYYFTIRFVPKRRKIWEDGREARTEEEIELKSFNKSEEVES